MIALFTTHKIFNMKDKRIGILDSDLCNLDIIGIQERNVNFDLLNRMSMNKKLMDQDQREKNSKKYHTQSLDEIVESCNQIWNDRSCWKMYGTHCCQSHDGIISF